MWCVMDANMTLYPVREMTCTLVNGQRQVASSAGPLSLGALFVGGPDFFPLGAPRFLCFFASFTAAASAETSCATLSLHVVPLVPLELARAGALGWKGFSGGWLGSLDALSLSFSPLSLFFLLGLKRLPKASRADAILGRCLKVGLVVFVSYFIALLLWRSHPPLLCRERRRCRIGPERAGGVNPWPQLRWTRCIVSTRFSSIILVFLTHFPLLA